MAALVAPGFAGCLGPEQAQLSVGDLWYVLSPNPRGGMSMLFNFTLYNDGPVDAIDVYVSIDGFNRTPSTGTYYGQSERTLAQIPTGASFLMEGRLDVYGACRTSQTNFESCGGSTYFTIHARPANGPAVSKQVLQEKY